MFPTFFSHTQKKEENTIEKMLIEGYHIQLHTTTLWDVATCWENTYMYKRNEDHKSC